MKLQQVRDAFESRIAFLEKEIAYFQGKLILVREALSIGAAMAGSAPSREPEQGAVAEPPADYEPTGQFHRQPFISVEEAPGQPEEEPSADETVSQFVPAYAESAEADEEAGVAEAEAFEGADDEPTAEHALEVDDTAPAEALEDAGAEEVLAELEPEEIEVTATVAAQSYDEDVEAETEPEVVEIRAEAVHEAQHPSEVEELKSELETLRSKLASAAAEETTRSPFNALGKFLSRAK